MSLPALWACDVHELIGTETEIEQHRAECGATYRLDDLVAEGVRDLWSLEGRDRECGRESLVPGLLMLAGLRRELRQECRQG